MRLVAQLLSGLQADLEVSPEELVCQVARRTARLLQTGRLKLITQASVVLPSWFTVEKAGLLEGELLTALVQRDIAGSVDIDVTDEPPEAEAIRRAVEAVDGPYAVKVTCDWDDDEAQLEEVPWAALSGAERLVLEYLALTPDNVDGVIRGLNQLTKLWRVDLIAHVQSPDVLAALLQALPAGLEELRVELSGTLPPVTDVATVFPSLRCLRTAEFGDIDDGRNHGMVEVLLAVLPSSLEDLAVNMNRLAFPCLVRHLPRMLGLKRLTLGAGSAHFEDLLACVKALPPGLAELDLGGCCLGYSADRFDAASFTIPGDLAELLQRFTQLRRSVCPQGGESYSTQEATAVLLALPRGLEDLGLPERVASSREELEVLEMGLRSFPGLKRVAFPELVYIGVWDRTAWERMFQALPGCLEHLEFGLYQNDASALDEAAAGQFKHLPNLKSVSLRNLKWSTAAMAALPQTVESICFKGIVRKRDVCDLRARLTEPQLTQLLRTNIIVKDCGKPEAMSTSEMFKAWLANG